MDNNLNETEINVSQNSVVQVDISNDSSVDVGVSAERSVIRGVDGFSPIAKVTQEADGAKITITDVSGTTTAKAFNGARGEKGERGEQGIQGVAGSDGFSPIATVTKSGDTATISITDKIGTTTASISDGTDGTNGTNGQDGFSPIANVTKTGDTATITITDKIGTTTASISDGTDGTNGTNGQDGFSPIATVTKSGDTATITITDRDGTTSASVSDGTDGTNGTNGQDGFSPIANVTQSGGVTTISITDKIGTTTSSITIPTKTSELTNDGANNTSTYVEASSLATVATTGSYPDLHNRPTIGNGKITIQKNSTEIDNFTVNQTGNKSINISVPTKTSELTNDSGFITSMVEMSYGEANAWSKFLSAYQAKQIVYCRASSGSNPASGSQTRKAFMAYVNNADNPTQVEFQYYRSVSSHSDSQQGDQVFIYLLTNANGGTWSVTTRNAFTKVVAGTNMTSSYANGAITLNATQPTKTSELTNDGSDGTSTYLQASDLALTNVTSSVTTGANVSIDTGGRVMTFGNLVIVNMDITTSASINAYGVLLSGMPTRNPNNFLWLSVTDGNNPNKTYRVYYDGGNIRTRDALPAGTYGMSFVYVKA